MYCSLVKFDGNFRNKIKDFEYQEVAETAGVKFIKVQHISVYGITCASPRGFQGVRVTALPGRLGAGRYKISYSKDALGKDTSAMLPLDFVCNKKTQELFALIPDTEYNRKKLAACYYHIPFCTILDKEIDAEIKKQADEIEAILPKGKAVEEIMVEYADENERLRAELAREKALREAAEIKSEVVSVTRDKIARERKLSNRPADKVAAADVKDKINKYYASKKNTKPPLKSEETNDGDNTTTGKSD